MSGESPNHLPDDLPPSFTRLYFESEDGRQTTSTVHDPVSEVKNLFEDIAEQIDQLRNNQNPDRIDTGVDEPIIPRNMRQDVISLYSLSSALIEVFTTELLLRELIEDDYRDAQKARRIFERDTRITNNLRLLLYTGIIDNSLHGELQNVVQKRHDYVHNPDSSLSIGDYDEFLSEARRCMRATKQLAVVLDGDDYRLGW